MTPQRSDRGTDLSTTPDRWSLSPRSRLNGRTSGQIDAGGSPVRPYRPGSAGHAAVAPSELRPRRTTHRPAVQPADPEAPGECLCGDPAEFIVDTNWFSGRRSRDPVCERHVTEVVAAIVRKQAGRDGG